VVKGRVDLLFLFHRLVILSSVQLSLLCRFFVFVFGLGARPMEPGASYLPPLPTLPSGGLSPFSPPFSQPALLVPYPQKF